MYNINKLPDYVNQANAEGKFLFESVLGGQTLDVLTDAGSYTDGVLNSTEAIHLMKNTLVWQDGKVCKLQELGETELSEAEVYVAPIAFKHAYCSLDLMSKWASETVRARKQSKIMDELLFGDAILEELTALNQKDVEKLLWQGQKNITDLGNNMRFINGFLTQMEGQGVDLSGVTGDSIVDKIKDGYLAMPVEVTSQDDFKVFVGLDTYRTYYSLIKNKDLYNKEEANAIFGTTANFTVVNGLNGTGKVVYTRARNLQTKGDLKSDQSQFDTWYEQNDDEMKVRARFGLGATVIFKSEVGVLDLG